MTDRLTEQTVILADKYPLINKLFGGETDSLVDRQTLWWIGKFSGGLVNSLLDWQTLWWTDRLFGGLTESLVD